MVFSIYSGTDAASPRTIFPQSSNNSTEQTTRQPKTTGLGEAVRSVNNSPEKTSMSNGSRVMGQCVRVFNKIKELVPCNLFTTSQNQEDDLAEIKVTGAALHKQVEEAKNNVSASLPFQLKGKAGLLMGLGLVVGAVGGGYTTYRQRPGAAGSNDITSIVPNGSRNGQFDAREMANYSTVISSDSQAWLFTGCDDPNDKKNREKWLKSNENVAKAISSHQPTFQIVNGDLTEFGRAVTYEDYEKAYKNNEYPVYEGLGNHDYANNVGDCYDIKASMINKDGCAVSAVKRMRAEIQDYSKSADNFNADISVSPRIPLVPMQKIEGSLSYSFDLGDVHYVQLQNYPTYETELHSLSPSASSQSGIEATTIKVTKSLEWLEKDLAEADARGKISVINFHDGKNLQYWWATPIKSEFINNSSEEELATFKKIITSHNVKAIFLGHLHQTTVCRVKDDAVYGDIPVYSSGALFDGEYFHLEVNGKEINVKAYNGITGEARLIQDYGPVSAMKAQTEESCSGYVRKRRNRSRR